MASFHDHPFIAAVRSPGLADTDELLAWVSKATLDELDGIEPEPEPPRTFREYYRRSVLKPLAGIQNTLRRLEQAEQYVSIDPRDLASMEDILPLGEWIDYHHTHYLVSAVTLVDCTYLLVNAVLRIGLQPQHCTASIVRSNDKVKVWGLDTPLKDLDTVSRATRTTRNLFVHRGEIPVILPRVFSTMVRSMEVMHQSMPSEVAEALGQDKVESNKREMGELLLAEAGILKSHIADTRIAMQNILADLFDVLHRRYIATAPVQGFGEESSDR